MKIVVHDPYVILEKETHHFKVKTNFFLEQIDLFFSIYEGWCTTVHVEGETWCPHFHVRGVPLLG
jgi:hypothetical protein